MIEPTYSELCARCGGRWLPRYFGESPGPCPWCATRELKNRSVTDAKIVIGNLHDKIRLLTDRIVAAAKEGK
jgi:hypothetical protein